MSDVQRPIYQGESREFLLTFTREEDVTDDNPEGRVDLTDHDIHYRWKHRICDLDPPEIAKSSDEATEIEKLTQSGDTLGQAVVYVTTDDTIPLAAGTHYHEAWIELDTGERYASIPPSEILVKDAVTDWDGAPLPAPGQPAPQGTAERCFKFTVPSDGDSFPVTIPGVGMYDTSYCVEARFSSFPAADSPSADIFPLETGRTKTQFTLAFGGTIAQDTVVDIIVRDS